MRGLLRVLSMIGALSAIGYGLSAGSEWSDRRWFVALPSQGCCSSSRGGQRAPAYSTFNRSTMRLATILLVVFGVD
ncbi:MAG: hypothetical protein R2849_22040 [Thermomicrobiales bacterium]